jgi:plastocyanin
MSRTRFQPAKVAALAAALSSAAVAVGATTAGASTPPTTPTETTAHMMTESSEAPAAAGGVDSPAATLRAGLTSLLQEHVYLAGAAISTAVGAGGDLEAPAVVSAVETLDANSVALSEAVASVYGPEAGEQFLALWRTHIGFFVDYTLGGATGDTAAQDAARANLDNYRADFGAFIDSATGGTLPADAVADALQVHVDSLLVAVDAVLAGTPDVYTKLRDAAQHMPMTALALAGAIATQMPEQFTGDVASPASELRSGLTHLLQEHVYLAGLAINQAVADGGDLAAPATADAVAALDANSVALSEAIASVYGPDAGEQFLALWRTHIGFFVDYTLGGATGDTAAQGAARADLDGYRAAFGAFVESATGGALPADAVAEELAVHVDSLLAAVDAVLAGSPDVFPLLRTAAQHMPGTALALAGAIATQLPGGDSAAPASVPATMETPATAAADMSGTETTQPAAAGVTVTISAFNFQPDPLTVAAGTTITFVNEDSIDHTVTAGTREAPQPELFDGELPERGATFELTLDEPGTYDYFCQRHSGPGMTGTIIAE